MKSLKHTNVRIPEEHLETLSKLADAEDISTADMIRRAVREYLERNA